MGRDILEKSRSSALGPDISHQRKDDLQLCVLNASSEKDGTSILDLNILYQKKMGLRFWFLLPVTRG